ncbi:reverse transcriptase domain-containing protein [Tanacetum coccineum]
MQKMCKTCGGAHSYRNCPATDGNVYRDNIQEYVSQAAAANFNKGNTNSRLSMVSNQIRPLGVSKTDFENYVKANDAVLRNMQNQGQGLQNQMTNLTEMLSKFITSNTASTNALADSGASINLLPHSIYNQLGLGALKPTRMTLELANRSVTHPMGIAEDVVVRVDGRPSFAPQKSSFIDLYEEKLTLRVGSDELVFYAEKSEKSKNKQFAHAISIIDFSKDEPFSGSTLIFRVLFPPCASRFNFRSKNVHANPSLIIESLPVSLIPVEDSDPVQEEINIFLVPDDLIPPGVENDDSEDEDNEFIYLDNHHSLPPQIHRIVA